jgi:hypothetical protein
MFFNGPSGVKKNTGLQEIENECLDEFKSSYKERWIYTNQIRLQVHPAPQWPVNSSNPLFKTHKVNHQTLKEDWLEFRNSIHKVQNSHNKANTKIGRMTALGVYIIGKNIFVS